VFICWSGGRSKAIAEGLKELLQRVLPELERRDGEADPVFLSEDIEKGAEWFQSIREELDRSKVGIVVLTRENLENPWIHFEAGALARELSATPSRDAAAPTRSEAGRGRPSRRHPRGLAETSPDQRLFPLLHKVEAGEIRGPLGAYQGTSTTRLDMGRLVSLLATVLTPRPMRKADQDGFIIGEEHWRRFERVLDSATIPVGKVIPDLSSMFQRKTFDEPLHHCADQAWLTRYEGARVTIDRLKRHEAVVEAACSTHEHGLFRMLLADLDVYAMAIQALLLRPKKFPLGSNGERVLDHGIRTCCEDRRLAIKSLTTRLLHPLDVPLTEEAVRFIAAETHEERKMVVHRLEGRIRAQRERAFLAIARGGRPAACEHEAIAQLEPVRALVEARAAQETETRPTGPRPAPTRRSRTRRTAAAGSDGSPLNLMRFRESSWDLDRIYYYLLVQYFGTSALRWDANGADTKRSAVPIEYEQLCAARDVEMEVERYRARNKGGSVTPLTYALCALQVLRPEEAAGRRVEHSVASALMVVKKEVGDLLSTDFGGPIAALVDQITDAMGRRRPARSARARSIRGRARADSPPAGRRSPP
jgi:hypothetical protein